MVLVNGIEWYWKVVLWYWIVVLSCIVVLWYWTVVLSCIVVLDSGIEWYYGIGKFYCGIGQWY